MLPTLSPPMTMPSRANFRCRHCGVCCQTCLCLFAQERYGLTAHQKCPDLVGDGDRYKCLMMERDEKMRKSMMSGKCDARLTSLVQPLVMDLSGVKEYLSKKGYIPCH